MASGHRIRPPLQRHKYMAYNKKLLLFVMILFSCVGCDRISKAAAQKYLASSQSISFIGSIVRFQYAENSGGFLSFGSSSSPEIRFWLLIVLTGIVVAGTLVFVLLKPGAHPAFVTAISFIVGGGVGNLIDRMFNDGRVIDFMNMGIGSLRTGVFNVADIAIMIGTGILVLKVCRDSRQARTF